jgi:hypothetical protein
MKPSAIQRAKTVWGYTVIQSNPRKGNAVIVDLNSLISDNSVVSHTASLIECMRECGHKIFIVSSLDETCRAWILTTLADNNILADDLFLRGTAVPIDLATEFNLVKWRMGDGWFKRVAFVIAGCAEVARNFAAVDVPVFLMFSDG